MADFDTSIRVTADTQQAVQSVTKLSSIVDQFGNRFATTLPILDKAGKQFGGLEAAMDKITRGAGPRIGSTFGRMAQQAIQMQGGIGGLSGGLSLLGGALYTLNPVLGIAAGALAAVAVSMIRKKDAVDEASGALRTNLKFVQDLIKGNQDLEGVLSLTARNKEFALRQEEGFLKNLIESYSKTIQPMTAFGVVSDATSVAVDKDTRSLDELIKRLGEVQRELAEGAEIFGPPTATVDEMAAASAARVAAAKKTAGLLREIQEMGHSALVNELSRQQAEEQDTSLAILTIIQERAQRRTQIEFTSMEQIVLAYDSLRDKTIDVYEKQIAAAQSKGESIEVIEATLADRLIAIEERRGASTVAIQRKYAKMTAKFQLETYAVIGSAFERLIRGQTALHGGFAAFFVQTIGEGVQGALRAYGALWAAEAAASAISNPALAASKIRAAAMAGVAIGVVGALTEVAVSRITREREQSVAEIGVVTTAAETASGERTRGRTLVSQGPVTLNYSAVLTINGGVYGIDDLFQQFQKWNLDQLRTAGMDTAQRAR